MIAQTPLPAALLGALRRCASGLTVEDAADAIWLAAVAPGSLRTTQDPVSPEFPQRAETSAAPSHEPRTPSGSLQPRSSTNTGRVQTPPRVQRGQRDLYLADREGQHSGTSLRIRSAAALPDKQGLLRALRPLIRRVGSVRSFELDVERTVHFAAEEDTWEPRLRPVLERWLHLSLIIERSPAMAIWPAVIRELRQALESSRAFASVRCFTLSDESGLPRLSAGWRAGGTPIGRALTPEGAIGPAGPSTSAHAVWVISDCVSDGWYGGQIASFLRPLVDRYPVALVHLFPPHLVERTAIGLALPVWLHAPAMLTACSLCQPAARHEAVPLPNSLLAPRRAGTRSHGLTLLPVLALDPSALRTWSRHIVATGDNCVAAVALPAGAEGAGERPAEDQNGLRALGAADRVRAFRAAATRPARQLAMLLASLTVPRVNLPMIKRVRSMCLPSARYHHEAEVLLSDLLQISGSTPGSGSHPEPEQVMYEFDAGIRELLLRLPWPESSEAVGVQQPTLEELLTRLGEPIQRKDTRPRDLHTILLSRRHDAKGSGRIASVSAAQDYQTLVRPALVKQTLEQLERNRVATLLPTARGGGRTLARQVASACSKPTVWLSANMGESTPAAAFYQGLTNQSDVRSPEQLWRWLSHQADAKDGLMVCLVGAQGPEELLEEVAAVLRSFLSQQTNNASLFVGGERLLRLRQSERYSWLRILAPGTFLDVPDLTDTEVGSLLRLNGLAEERAPMLWENTGGHPWLLHELLERDICVAEEAERLVRSLLLASGRLSRHLVDGRSVGVIRKLLAGETVASLKEPYVRYGPDAYAESRLYMDGFLRLDHGGQTCLRCPAVRHLFEEALVGRSAHSAVTPDPPPSRPPPADQAQPPMEATLFWGRELELGILLDRYRSNSLLIGPRSMGKSTLLAALARELAKRFPSVRVLRHQLFSESLQSIQLADPLVRTASPEALYASVMERCREHQIFLLDESDRFVAAELRQQSPFGRVMADLQQQGRASFVLAGHQALYEAAAAPDSPFRTFQQIRLGPLEKDAARRMILDPLTALGLRLSEKARTVNWLCEQTGRRPHLLATVMSILPNLRSGQTPSPIAFKEVTTVVLASWRMHALFGDWRDSVHPLDRALARVSLLLDRPTPAEAVQYLEELHPVKIDAADLRVSLDRLQNWYFALVLDEHGRLSFPVPLFRAWITNLDPESSAAQRERDPHDRIRDELARDLAAIQQMQAGGA